MISDATAVGVRTRKCSNGSAPLSKSSLSCGDVPGRRRMSAGTSQPDGKWRAAGAGETHA